MGGKNRNSHSYPNKIKSKTLNEFSFPIRFISKHYFQRTKWSQIFFLMKKIPSRNHQQLWTPPNTLHLQQGPSGRRGRDTALNGDTLPTLKSPTGMENGGVRRAPGMDTCRVPQTRFWGGPQFICAPTASDTAPCRARSQECPGKLCSDPLVTHLG